MCERRHVEVRGSLGKAYLCFVLRQVSWFSHFVADSRLAALELPGNSCLYAPSQSAGITDVYTVSSFCLGSRQSRPERPAYRASTSTHSCLPHL